VREESHVGAAKRRGTATKVQEITNWPIDAPDDGQNPQRATTAIRDSLGKLEVSYPWREKRDLPAVASGEPISPPDSRMPGIADEVLLQEVAETLTVLASRADQFPVNAKSTQPLDQMETALAILRQAFAGRTAAQ
jgi:hypothetical protein